MANLKPIESEVMKIDNKTIRRADESLIYADAWCSNHPDGYATIFEYSGAIRKQECRYIQYYFAGMQLQYIKSQIPSDLPAHTGPARAAGK